ncbi:MAG: LptE family protein [Bacteroidetes bacterium]|nr:LptE family protein [Bacteroidota bacterium]
MEKLFYISLKSHIGLYKLIFGLSIVMLFNGCYSFKAGQIPKEVKTYSVQFFPNRASIVNPVLSQTFTEKLKLKWNNESSLSLKSAEGDYAFEGYISNYTNGPVAIQSNQTAAQNRLTITVNVKFINSKDEKANFETSFSRFADYSSSLNFATQEQKLVDNIVGQLVDDIFNKCTSNW